MMPRMTARSVAGTAASILVLLVCVGAVFALRHYVPSPADVMRTPFVREAAFNESVSLRTYELLARDVTVTKKVEMGSHTYVSPEVFVVVGLELSGGTTERKIGTIEAVSASGLLCRRAVCVLLSPMRRMRAVMSLSKLPARIFPV